MRYVLVICAFGLTGCLGGLTGGVETVTGSDPAIEQAVDAAVSDTAPDEAAPQDAPEKRGIFGNLFKRGENNETAVVANADAVDAAVSDVVPPSGDVSSDAIAQTETAPAQEPEKKQGWLASLRRTPIEPEVAPDSGPLPFGRFVKVCGVQPQNKATKVGTAAGFTLYDSNPSLNLPRTHYVTGFRDRCARKFTAAAAVFGAPSLHEFIKYQQKRPSYSALELEYEKVKSSICSVPERAPCAKRMARLERSVTFLSIYSRFGGDGFPANVLLGKRQVLASDFDVGT